MLVQFTRAALVGDTGYSPGDRAELPDEVARRHLKAGSAAVAVETADAPHAPESADAGPGKRRRA